MLQAEEHAMHDAPDVRVERHVVEVESERADGRNGVRPDSGQRPEISFVRWDAAVEAGDHFFRGAL